MKKKRMGEEDRVRTNVILSKEVFNLACDYKINLSSFLENQLLNYFAMRQQIFNQRKIQYPTVTKYTPVTHVQQMQPTQRQGGKTSDLQRSGPVATQIYSTGVIF